MGVYKAGRVVGKGSQILREKGGRGGKRRERVLGRLPSARASECLVLVIQRAFGLL